MQNKKQKLLTLSICILLFILEMGGPKTQKCNISLKLHSQLMAEQKLKLNSLDIYSLKEFAAKVRQELTDITIISSTIINYRVLIMCQYHSLSIFSSSASSRSLLQLASHALAHFILVKCYLYQRLGKPKPRR